MASSELRAVQKITHLTQRMSELSKSDPQEAESLFDRTWDLIPQLEQPEQRRQRIEHLVEEIGQFEDNQLARTLLVRGADRVQYALEPEQQVETLPRFATQLHRLGDTKQAESLLDRTWDLVSQLEQPEQRRQQTEHWVEEIGQFEDNQLARTLLARGADRVQRTLEPEQQVEALPRFATQLIRLGDTKQAESLFDRMWDLVSQLEQPEQRRQQTEHWVEEIGQFEDNQLARTLLARGADRVQHTLGSEQQVEALPRFAAELIRLGDTKQAESLFGRTFEVILDLHDKEQALMALRQVTDDAMGDLGPQKRLQIVPSLARRFAQAGDLSHARVIFNEARDLFPQVSQLEQIQFLAMSAKSMVNYDFQKSIELMDNAYQVAVGSAPGREKWEPIIEASESMPAVEFFAVARVAGLCKGSPLILHREHKLLVSIQRKTPAGFVGKSLQLRSSGEAEIDVIVRATGMEILPAWAQKATCFQNRASSPLEFILIPRESSCKEIRVELYYQRHWLADIKLDIEVT
jgi:tetratricopeptide (TPR) repeat protein